ncbi:MAG TPA: 3-dehydroquinate synthase [Terriglobales bacterium]|nr:3-dehydroquinate synthase [Terriglobales bacterium]
MIRIPVTAPSRSYEVLIESGSLERSGESLSSFVGGRRAFIVTVPPVRKPWANVLVRSLAEANVKSEVLVMPDGESAKRLSTLEKLAEQLVKAGADRGTILIALGGGVACDVTGFLASVYMRGVDVIQIPTTVLAQVDAAIGGKTGVNLLAGKNLIGTFHQPRVVLIDPAVLKTLSPREYRAGLYESLKAGIIGEPSLFRLFEEKHKEILARDPEILERVIADSVRLKASVVSSDERESGLRQVLNLGHTIGHALEAETGYKLLLHGEAVGWGLVAATYIALSTGRLDSVTAGRIMNAVLGLGELPPLNVKIPNILNRLKFDKKTRQGVVHFILPREIGKVEITSDVTESDVRSALEEMRKLTRH